MTPEWKKKRSEAAKKHTNRISMRNPVSVADSTNNLSWPAPYCPPKEFWSSSRAEQLGRLSASYPNETSSSAILAMGFPRCRRTKSMNFRQKASSLKVSAPMYFVPRRSIRTKQHLDSRDGRTSSSTPISPAMGAVDPKKGFHFGGQCFFNNGCSRNFISTNLHRSEEARPEEVSTSVSQFPLIFEMQLPEIGFASDTPKRFRSKSLVFNLCNRFSAIDWP